MAIGDAGFGYKGSQYNTILNGGMAARVFIGQWLSFGLGGEFRYEPQIAGNPLAPHYSDGVVYEDFVRGEVLQEYFDANPAAQNLYQSPIARSNHSFKAIFQAGLYGLGPLKWNNLFVNVEKSHPENVTEESFNGEKYDIYITRLTDERLQVNIGNEAHITLLPERLDLLFGLLFGLHTDEDNDVTPSDFDRTFYSAVLRLQGYVTDTVHLLLENSLAREISHNGNAFRRFSDSVFQSTDGVADSRGLEYGDSDIRDTWQGKVGVVLSPVGIGIFSRPALRLLYGVQYSTQNNAFGNSFVESLDQVNNFPHEGSNWHHVISLEAEIWF